MIAQPQPGVSVPISQHGLAAAAGLAAQDVAPDIAAFMPRDRIEAGLAEQLVLLGAVLRDGCGRMLSPDLPSNLAPRMLGAVTSLAREIRAVTLMLIRRQAESLPHPDALPDGAEEMLSGPPPIGVTRADGHGQEPGRGVHPSTAGRESRPSAAASDPMHPDAGADPGAAEAGQGAIRHEPAGPASAGAIGHRAAGVHVTGPHAADAAGSTLAGPPRHRGALSTRASLLSQAACVDAVAGLSRPADLPTASSAGRRQPVAA